MKRALLFVLLVSLAIAGSALTKEDFSYTIDPDPTLLSENLLPVKVWVRVPQNQEFIAFNTTIRFNGVTGVTSQEEFILLNPIKPNTPTISEWHMNTTEPGQYDLSNAFEIVSWDDSVALSFDEMASEVSEEAITIRGWTDSAALCEEHNYAGFWGETENCQVKITVNNKEYWAERSGVFAIDYELAEGENRIDVRAMDPGGNTVEETLFVTYNPSVGTQLESNVLLLIAGVVLLIAVVGLIIIWYNSIKAKKLAEQEAKKVYEKYSLEELREKQKEVFQDFARKSGLSGRPDPETGRELVKIFQHITQKDQYYEQQFPDVRLAIREHEGIFKQENIPPGIKNLLLEQYSKQLNQKLQQAP